MSRTTPRFLALAAALLAVVPVPPRAAAGGAGGPVEVERIDPPESGFYAKRLDYRGIPIKAHADVADEALAEARRRLDRMLGKVPDVAANLAAEGAELHVIGKDQVTSDLPEHRALKGKPFDGRLTVDQRTRGLGGLLASCGEENLLRLEKDRYRGRDICLHEFAHTVLAFGLSADVRRRVAEQHRKATGEGLWKTAYAGSNDDEYFAELTMWYFGTRGDYGNLDPKPEPGPDWLKRYDPDGFALLDDLYSGRMAVARLRPVALDALPPDREGSLKSRGGGGPTTVRFVNGTPKPVDVFWLDLDGKRRRYATIPPGGRDSRGTFADHAWLLADKDGTGLRIFVARPEAGVGVLERGADAPPAAPAGRRPRARELGVPFEGTPGPLDAITDVPGVAVGHATLIAGEGKLEVGKGPVRTGVTAVLPRGKGSSDPVFAGFFSLNGNGEMTGTAWVEESGELDGPVMLTNTHSVGVVRDAVIAYRVAKDRTGRADDPDEWWSLPVVAETWDGQLNDINGFHVKPRHVAAALDGAATGPVAEGNVGGGTGMTCYGFKGGIGTASRRLGRGDGGYTVGVLVQANHGLREQLLVAGVPVGREIGAGALRRREAGSIIIVIATDAPLLPHQLKRLARRASLGLARTGSVSGNGSGDLFLAFSTAKPEPARAGANPRFEALPNHRMDPLFEATVGATEEAIVNALVAAETMTGVDGRRAVALPHGELRDVLRKYNRLARP